MALDIVELAIAAMLEMRGIGNGLRNKCATEAFASRLLLDRHARGLGGGSSGCGAGHLRRRKGARRTGLLWEDELVNVHLIRVLGCGSSIGLGGFAKLGDATGARLSAWTGDAAGKGRNVSVGLVTELSMSDG